MVSVPLKVVIKLFLLQNKSKRSVAGNGIFFFLLQLLLTLHALLTIIECTFIFEEIFYSGIVVSTLFSHFLVCCSSPNHSRNFSVAYSPSAPVSSAVNDYILETSPVFTQNFTWLLCHMQQIHMVCIHCSCEYTICQ